MRTACTIGSSLLARGLKRGDKLTSGRIEEEARRGSPEA